MSYRSDSEDSELKWLNKNREHLAKAGIPLNILDNRGRWNYVLLHGDDSLVTCWSTESLSTEQAENVLNTLSEFYQNESGLDLFLWLRRKTGSRT